MTRESAPRSRPVTVPKLRRMKAKGERITMVTAYDATFARMFDEGGADVLLVGDSLGMVVQGLDTTLPVTIDEVIYHCRAVARGTRRAHIVGDMPFLSHQISPEDALRNAGRFLREGGAHSIKLEGGRSAAPTVRRLVEAGVPIVRPPGGHAVYIDAGAMLPHIPPAELPGQALACAFYLEGGVRGVEIGTLMFAGAAKLELLRLAIPRRVYTQSQIDYVIDVASAVAREKHDLRGLRIVEEAPHLRHFSAKLEPLP